jgi:molybdopterin-guanine dinucleotide biosynthesis protein MobB
VHIIGRKNSGKTTLICELIRSLSEQGIKVGSIKHTPHQHEFDQPGKDSQRHRAAGAVAAGILSPEAAAVFWTIPAEYGKDERYAVLLRMYADCDLVLVEGDTQTTAPKVEVWRSATGAAPFASAGVSVHAIVTDDPLDGSMLCWSRSDVPAIARSLMSLANSE